MHLTLNKQKTIMNHITLYSIDERGHHVQHADLCFMSFPGGERHVRLPMADIEAKQGEQTHREWILRANVYTPADIMDLLLTTDAVRRILQAGSVLRLEMPYIPYARQDRVAVEGEPLSIKVFASLINSMGFDSVTVWDPHSDVSTALINNVYVAPAADRMVTAMGAKGSAYLLRECAFVAPDVGACKRVTKLANMFKTDVVCADKVRDPVSGALSGTVIRGDLPQRPLLVVDDICDAGGTFIQLAKALREKTDRPLYLYVTHGLFTKGVAPLKACYDKVFAANCKDPAHESLLG